jgi:hypothetical protein
MTFSPSDIAARYNLLRRSDRWAGPCPKCGGSNRSDKFVLKEDGGFKCYGCDFKGDAITWLREMESMSCPDAHEAAGKACEAFGCPVRSSCRMGDGKGRAAVPRSVAPVVPPVRSGLKVAEAKNPADLWRAWALAFVEKSAKALEKCEDTLNWLAARGIQVLGLDAIEWCLGWNERSAKIDRASIGLPPERDGKTDLWVPAGLVIPTIDAAGNVHRLRIRRTDADREKFLPDLKYVWLEGSGTAPWLATVKAPRGVVVVEAELDAMACAAAHHEVAVVALGTVAAALTPEISAILAAAPVILVALDADPGKDGKAGAGPKAIKSWLSKWRQARYWPVPAGKDPGDYVRDHGGNLRQWIEAGLVPAAAGQVRRPAGQAEEPISLLVPNGGKGEEVVDNKPSLPGYVRGLSRGGMAYVLTEHDQDRPVLEVAFPGEAVFSYREMGHVKQMGEYAEAALMTKLAFPGAVVLGHREKVVSISRAREGVKA